MMHYSRLLLFALLVSILSVPSAADSLRRPIKVITFPGHTTVSRLALDATHRRLYLVDRTHVQAVYLDLGTSVGQIPDIGAYDFVLAPDLGRGFLTNEIGVTPVDLRTLIPSDTPFAPGAFVNHLLYDSISQSLLTFDQDNAQVSAWNAITGAAEGTGSLGGRLQNAVTDDRGILFAAIQSMDLKTGSIVVLDSHTLAERARWALPPDDRPINIALDQEHRRLFAVCGHGNLLVLNADTGQVVASLVSPQPFLRIPQSPCLFDAISQQLIVATRGGAVAVLHEETSETFSWKTPISVPDSLIGMVIDPVSDHLYLATAKHSLPPPNIKRRQSFPPFQASTFAVRVYSL